jgi:hypothetical protein
MDIENLSLENKQELLRLLLLSEGIVEKVSVEVKLTEHQIEARKCNEIVAIKKAGGNVVMTELQF